MSGLPGKTPGPKPASLTAAAKAAPQAVATPQPQAQKPKPKSQPLPAASSAAETAAQPKTKPIFGSPLGRSATAKEQDDAEAFEKTAKEMWLSAKQLFKEIVSGIDKAIKSLFASKPENAQKREEKKEKPKAQKEKQKGTKKVEKDLDIEMVSVVSKSKSNSNSNSKKNDIPVGIPVSAVLSAASAASVPLPKVQVIEPVSMPSTVAAGPSIAAQAGDEASAVGSTAANQPQPADSAKENQINKDLKFAALLQVQAVAHKDPSLMNNPTAQSRFIDQLIQGDAGAQKRLQDLLSAPTPGPSGRPSSLRPEGPGADAASPQ